MIIDQAMFDKASEQILIRAHNIGIIAPYSLGLGILFGIWSSYFFNKDFHCHLSKSYVGRALLTAIMCFILCGAGICGMADSVSAEKYPELFVLKELGCGERKHHPVPVVVPMRY